MRGEVLACGSVVDGYEARLEDGFEEFKGGDGSE